MHPGRAHRPRATFPLRRSTLRSEHGILNPLNFLLRVLAVILVLAASQAKAWSMAPGGGTAYMGNDTGSGSRAQEPTVTSYGHDAIGNGIANAGKAIATDPKGVFNAARDDIAFQTNLLVSDVKNFVGASEVRSWGGRVAWRMCGSWRKTSDI